MTKTRVKTLKRRKIAVKKSCSRSSAEDSGADFSSKEAIALLTKIIRGDQIELFADEMQPASLAQRISAAQILLRLQNQKSKENQSQEFHEAKAGIDFPDRAENFQEWLHRAQAMRQASDADQDWQ